MSANTERRKQANKQTKKGILGTKERNIVKLQKTRRTKKNGNIFKRHTRIRKKERKITKIREKERKRK